MKKFITKLIIGISVVPLAVTIYCLGWAMGVVKFIVIDAFIEGVNDGAQKTGILIDKNWE